MVVRGLVRLALVLYFALMLSLVGLRYLLVPQLDNLRPYLVEKIRELLLYEHSLTTLKLFLQMNQLVHLILHLVKLFLMFYLK